MEGFTETDLSKDLEAKEEGNELYGYRGGESQAEGT